MVGTFVVALIVAAVILWLTIWVTNKAYAKKWERLDDEL